MPGRLRRQPHAREPHRESFAARLNWLRAGVLGANDGIISIAGLVIGVAAATSNRDEIATAGLAGLVAGAVSMALGEYVSVSAQRDSERSLVEKERRELDTMPDAERAELEGLLRDRGLSAPTAAAAAAEMSEHDVLHAHVDLELRIDEERLVNPWAAAGSSALSFTVGAVVPFIAILVPPTSLRIPVAFAAVVLALVVTGWLSALLGGAPSGRAIARLVVGGALAMGITFGIGLLFGTATG